MRSKKGAQRMLTLVRLAKVVMGGNSNLTQDCCWLQHVRTMLKEWNNDYKMMRVSLFQASGGEEDGRRTHGTGCQPSPPGWAIHQMSSTATSNQNVSRRVKNSPKDSRESLAPPASWRRATCLVGCWRAREGGWLHLDMMVMVAF